MFQIEKFISNGYFQCCGAATFFGRLWLPAPQHWLFRSVKDVDLLLKLPVEELRIRIRIQMTWIRRLADDLAEKVSSTGPL